MSLPVLDRDSYRHTSSEWVVRAGLALREAGYLTADPTGVFDEEFAAAVAAFQEARGIHEGGEVGPFTWDALGVQDAAAQYATGEYSEDGQWQWDGNDWVAAGTADDTAGTAEPATADHAADHAAAPAGQLSEDGQWRWDGSQWQAAVEPVAVPALVSGAVTAAPAAAAGAGPSEFEDTELADAIVRYELGILRQWKAALDSFNEVMESETTKTAQPDFAAALAKVFAEKVLGELAKESKSELVIGLLKGVVGEAERARNAQKSVAFRDFYTTHQTQIANVDKELEMKKAGFVAGVRREVDRMLRDDPDAYGMLRMELMDLYQDVEQRYQTATQEALFSELSAEWTRLSVNRISWNAEAAAEIRVRLHDSDLSVIDVVINAPDGDKLVDQMTGQPGGMDVWHMRAPKLLIFMDDGENAVGYVRLDADNKLTNLPAEQDGRYRQRYDRLVRQGGLPPVTRN
jgi:hypothetical protein